MKRIALLLTVALFATSLTGCGCLRRIRGTLCPGAYCGSKAPLFGSVSAPVATPNMVVTNPQVVRPPTYVQPRVVQPQAMPCCPCPTVVCDPCCETCNDCCGTTTSAGYAGDCGCNAPFGINVAPNEYLGEIQTDDETWGTSDPGPTP
ncbi:hypothetical protein [Aeoliella mucimassa]|uniref:Uncharacterized protein n=1 Tax=Aeoliella mucimassa TaxID=2527972 RepID=A0A518AV96_9BACT|nr:hypothetical protein [Aeoliella mucimassa]QDU58655.1 hypothetical protein Pan181_48940 [Aeoliella mucimassa]